jgi:phospholipid N-methyltransferase
VDLVLGELDLRDDDTVLDVGAGDGWWTRRIVDLIGDNGVVYALEVDTEKVNALKETFADDPRIIPILGKTDSTTLTEQCCDLVFISQVYHHLPEDGRVDYLRHLGNIIKSTGRVVVLERYSGIDVGRGEHGTRLSDLIRQAEEGGWVLLRYELLPGTYHYLTIFAPKPLFPLEPPRNTTNDNNG